MSKEKRCNTCRFRYMSDISYHNDCDDCRNYDVWMPMNVAAIQNLIMKERTEGNIEMLKEIKNLKSRIRFIYNAFKDEDREENETIELNRYFYKGIMENLEEILNEGFKIKEEAKEE